MYKQLSSQRSPFSATPAAGMPMSPAEAAPRPGKRKSDPSEGAPGSKRACEVTPKRPVADPAGKKYKDGLAAAINRAREEANELEKKLGWPLSLDPDEPQASKMRRLIVASQSYRERRESVGAELKDLQQRCESAEEKVVGYEEFLYTNSIMRKTYEDLLLSPPLAFSVPPAAGMPRSTAGALPGQVKRKDDSSYDKSEGTLEKRGGGYASKRIRDEIAAEINLAGKEADILEKLLGRKPYLAPEETKESKINRLIAASTSYRMNQMRIDAQLKRCERAEAKVKRCERAEAKVKAAEWLIKGNLMTYGDYRTFLSSPERTKPPG